MYSTQLISSRTCHGTCIVLNSLVQELAMEHVHIVLNSLVQELAMEHVLCIVRNSDLPFSSY